MKHRAEEAEEEDAKVEGDVEVEKDAELKEGDDAP